MEYPISRNLQQQYSLLLSVYHHKNIIQMDIMYNKEDKEVAVILGYGIGNHLSLNYLTEICRDIKAVFPKLSIDEIREIKFWEVAESSRRHKRMWYTKFSYDLTEYMDTLLPISEHITVDDHQVYCIGSHKKGVDGWTYEDETAKQVMDKLIRD